MERPNRQDGARSLALSPQGIAAPWLACIFLLPACGRPEGHAAALNGTSDANGASNVQSLTGANFAGKKYYLGWGAAAGGDPQMMHNEVKYDVLHTNDIFTKKLGGDYLGTTFTGTGNVNSGVVKSAWETLRAKMSPRDMFVQYSSGHGMPTGLGIGVSYAQIRDAILSMPAKEIIVVTMACYSGGLIDAFNQRKAEWDKWAESGRTLFVMSSSTGQETSSTGPGTDDDEGAGDMGTAGSAFGHAVWKSLIGYADGYVDGVKDGFISLGELQAYAAYKTKSIGGHSPMHTGTFNVNLILNQIPSQAQIEALVGANSTEGLDEEQIRALVQAADQDLATNPN